MHQVWGPGGPYCLNEAGYEPEDTQPCLLCVTQRLLFVTGIVTNTPRVRLEKIILPTIGRLRIVVCSCWPLSSHGVDQSKYNNNLMVGGGLAHIKTWPVPRQQKAERECRPAVKRTIHCTTEKVRVRDPMENELSLG